MVRIKVGQIQLESYDKDTEFHLWVFVFKLAGSGKLLMVLNGRGTWSELLFIYGGDFQRDRGEECHVPSSDLGPPEFLALFCDSSPSSTQESILENNWRMLIGNIQVNFH